MPGIFGIMQSNNCPNGDGLAKQLDRMHGRLAHLPTYRYQYKIYPEAAFGILAINESARLIEIQYQNHPYLVLIDGHVYSIDGAPRPVDNTLDVANRILAIALDGSQKDLTQIQGNYTIAIYDPGRHSLLLFNDIVGPRRFYYAVGPDKIIFAPELKGICAVNGFEKRIDWDGVADFLNFGYVLGERTFLKNISSLASATALSVSSAIEIQSRKYWRPVYTESQNDLASSVSNCFELLRTSIAEKLPGRGTVISPISGGLDSRIILGVLHRDHKETDILAVTYGQTFSKEYTNGRRVCETLGIDNHRLVTISPESLIDKYLTTTWLCEGMIPITNALLLLLPGALGIQHERVLNGIYGGPTNYDALYFANRHLEQVLSFPEQVRDIQKVLAIGSANYDSVLSNKQIPSIGEHAFDSIAEELKKVSEVSARFCNQRDTFFIENRMRRCINQSALYRFFWDEHLPLSNYNLYYNYLDIAAELKVGRMLLKSMLKTYFPDLARIPDANTGLDLFTYPSQWHRRISDSMKRLKYYFSRISGGRIIFYDKTTYAHYGNWFKKHQPTFELWRRYLFSEDFLDTGLLDPKRLKSMMEQTRKTGLGFHHICRITTFSMWFNLFMIENSTLLEATAGMKNIIQENR